MEAVKVLFEEEKISIIAQENSMSEMDREDFLATFNENKDGTLLGFCVLGGIFSEGIDLRKDSLIGTIIVGPGLPSICTSCQILRDFYDDKSGMGYEYAYIYPGMNKVLQAAGRVIRTEEDQGVIALLEERFLNDQYLRLFPKEWYNYKTVVLDNVKEEVLDFWNKMNYN